MGLFKKIFGKPAQPGKVEQIEIDPGMIYANTSHMANYLQLTLLKQYEVLLNSGRTLTLQQYDAIMPTFVNLARSFEKVYELMQFDREKLLEIKKYNEETYMKRMELVKFLDTPEQPQKPAEPAPDLSALSALYNNTPPQTPQQQKR